MTAPFTLVVSAGTYHLPFNRLIDWVSPWAERHPEVRTIVQHGPGRKIPGAENHVIFPAADLLQLYRTADAIVLQGGAGGVMDTWHLGRIPIVVPRLPIRHEVVDTHQLVFTAQVADLGIIHRAETEQELWLLLDKALSGALPTRTDTPDPTPGIAAAGALLAKLPAAQAGTTILRKLGRTGWQLLSRR